MPPRSKTSPARPAKDSTPPPSKKAPARDNLAGFREIDRKLRESMPKPEPVPARPVDADAQRRFDDLRDVAVSLGTAVDLKEILDRAVDGILRVAGCERGLVFLAQDDGSFATYTGRERDHGSWNEKDLRQISGTIVKKVAATHQPFIVSDTQKSDDLKTRGSIHDGMIISAVCLPLLYDDRLTGVIYADSRFVAPQQRDSDRGVLQLFSVLASLAIEHARRHGDLMTRGDRLEEQNLMLARQLAAEFRMGGTVAKSKIMMEIFETIATVAPADHIFVLIQGESGTGKEGLAHAIHDRSPRRGRPFLAVNCAGIATTLVEDALFGHSRGAFTGADSDRSGVFEAANGGTVFLDEIGDMPIETQAKLLRVLEQREVTRLGENTVRPVDFRVVSATNRDLPKAVTAGTFREDLYYRLRGTTIKVPPLRDRPEDILPLAEYFLDHHASKEKQPRPQLSMDARRLLMGHAWPGNVRELKKVIETAILYQDSDHVINAKAVERELAGSGTGAAPRNERQGSLRSQTEQFEEQLVRQVLADTKNNVAAAAKVLGLSRQQLYMKIRKYRIVVRAE
jgi:transcriptional regulator with GAF, ATPase, and Fis domain